jgi:hypothetical protein
MAPTYNHDIGIHAPIMRSPGTQITPIFIGLKMVGCQGLANESEVDGKFVGEICDPIPIKVSGTGLTVASD